MQATDLIYQIAVDTKIHVHACSHVQILKSTYIDSLFGAELMMPAEIEMFTMS